MRRLLTVVVLFIGLLFAASPADAFWRHHGWGWGHRWGGWGWGHRAYYRPWGVGYRGYRGWGYPYYYGYRGIPYGGYGGYYGGGYYPSYYSGYSPWYGCYNSGGSVPATVTVGYPSYGNGMYAAAPRPTTAPIFGGSPASTIVASAPAKSPVQAAVATAPPSALALQRFLGLKDIHPISVGAPGSALASAPLPPVVSNVIGNVLARVTNADSHQKAERMISEGDELFRAQNFHSALQKYKLAASTAPDVPETFWRQGHALVATHNYELATTAFKRAIGLTEDLGRGGFRLSDIYGGANMTKNQHLESLAEWSLKRRNSSDPYFLLGLFLEYDGQPVRAEKFFQKASDLAGFSGGHIAVFLTPDDPPAPVLHAEPSRPAASAPVIPISIGTEI